MASSSTNIPKRSASGALIFLHGLGDGPEGWSELESILPSFHSRLNELVYIFPPAPTIPITINGGARMPGWFDIFDWPLAVGSKSDPQGLKDGVASIQAVVEKLQQEHDIPPSKIVVGGFSQGGAVALLAAYQNDSGEPFAGCAALSGWLSLPGDTLEVPEAARKTPLFWGHGKFDDKVLFSQQEHGVMKLREQGVTVDDRSYDMGHSSHPEEMKAFADFVDARLFGSDKEEL